ncbi:hypothetical protein F6X40_34685 [Paraburkholderia sp. UCT31]|uniref:hypothetical protein n=1 Tax=Paraburkholderia sp. UCT31 TaxID=2615209 RepID=UPI0016551532|nr:hypothetical protein [Paraburkholderia sp. UCT31]MBC8741711.1 hypothetical protein [Paraburkholderia sp. UCT31]
MFADAAGGREVHKDGQALGFLSSPTGFDPMNSNVRYKTVLEVVNTVCGQHESGGLAAIGAMAAIRAMMDYWESHLDSGHSPVIILRDVDELAVRLQNMRQELEEALRLNPDSACRVA